MSTSVPPIPAPPAPSATSPSSEPPSGAPAGSPASSAPTAPWRVPESDPRVWARGKTAEEVLNIAGQLEGVVQRYVTGSTPAPAPAPVAPPTQQAFPSDEYIRGADIERIAPKLIDERMAPQFQQIFESNAQLALEQVKREFPDYFAKYSPTINTKLASVDKRAWTVDNLRTVVKLSVVDHLDDVLRDARQNAPPMEPALRSTGAAPVPVTSAPADDYSLNSEKLAPEYRERLKAAGVTDATLDEFLRATGTTRAKFFEMASKRQVITEAPRR